jgi:hypothetical protein
MKTRFRWVSIAWAVVVLASSQVSAQQQTEFPAAVPAPDAARPADPTANLPSDSGSHTTLPSGAVTGAGLAQGTGKQPDVGEPGGLEPRARALAREEALAEQSADNEIRSRSAGTRERPDSRTTHERHELGK